MRHASGTRRPDPWLVPKSAPKSAPRLGARLTLTSALALGLALSACGPFVSPLATAPATVPNTPADSRGVITYATYQVVVVRDGDTVAATAQLTVIPGLSRGGATRLQIEAVRVASPWRGRGLGGALLEWAHEHGRARGAVLSQLTTDASRVDAHRFYERLGYEASHLGLKRPL